MNYCGPFGRGVVSGCGRVAPGWAGRALLGMIGVTAIVAVTSGCASQERHVAPSTERRSAAVTTFEICMARLQDDRRECWAIFKGDTQGGEVCGEGAALKFTNCVDSLKPVGSD